MSWTWFASALLLGLTGCSDRSPPPAAVDRIEIRLSGWTSVEINVDGRGAGGFRLSHPFPEGRSGDFSVTPQQFHRLRDRLEPYRAQAVPVTTASAQEFIERTCPRDVPFATDSGAFYIRWTGPGVDRHFLADLGCDHVRQASRNKDLLGLVESLPVPKDR
jgi:hypothetical protein